MSCTIFNDVEQVTIQPRKWDEGVTSGFEKIKNSEKRESDVRLLQVRLDSCKFFYIFLCG